MTIAAPVAPNWAYDYGDITGPALAALTTPNISPTLTAAQAAVASTIASGALGSTSALYRVIIRSSPAGYSSTITLTPP